MKFIIEIHNEELSSGKKVFVGTVQENDISSFGDTPEEALEMTIEALQLVLATEEEMKIEASLKKINIKESKIIKQISTLKNDSQKKYSISFPSYAESFQVKGSGKSCPETMMVA